MTLRPVLDLPKKPGRRAYDYGQRASGGTHGVVLTKPHVVRLILDLSGYVPERDLASRSLLEPSCGEGAFLVQAVDRLMGSAHAFGYDAIDLRDAILAFDIDPNHVQLARKALTEVLERHGVGKGAAQKLVHTWVRTGDFLLSHPQRRFEYVVGNPPYVRIERLCPDLQSEYRRRFESLYDRADLYVAFIEKGLALLADDGALSFICPDRWVQNRYGAALRRIVSERFRVRCYLDLHHGSPFDSDVVAYPSIFLISPGVTGQVSVGVLDTASPEECRAVSAMICGGSGRRDPGRALSVYPSWFKGDEPWIMGTPAQLQTLRDLERRFEPIEDGRTRVGIGVATGSDKLYITDGKVNVEPDRLVPLVMRGDIENGRIRNAGRFVINTFGDDGCVVDLDAYPRLRKYLTTHAPDIKKRHVARKNPGSWFRTIDRVYPERVAVPKLLIPDIAGSNQVAFDAGHYHPHHNLYFVTSDRWDMEVLGGLISSKVALFFIWSYAVKMRGGYLRFQAQYLRRIRLPDPASIEARLASNIKQAFRRRDFKQLDWLALRAYGLRALPHFDFVDTRT
jgi:adenine-specific DNA-methyltransferase